MVRQNPDSDISYVTGQLDADWVVAPGALIKAELDAHHYSQSDVATRTNISTKHLNQLINGHVPLSPEIAVALERVLHLSAELLLQMDATWQADKVRRSSSAPLAQLHDWISKFPRAALDKFGVVDSSAAVADTADALLRFFRVADEASFNRVWLAPQVNYRRSQKFTVDPYATALWRRLAEVQAEGLIATLSAYEPSKLRGVAQQIPALSRLTVNEGFSEARRLLSEAGVLLVFVPEIAETRICGATWWLNPAHPVIALTGRYKFVDVFWFTMIHEVAHVLLHPKRATFMHFERTRGLADDADKQEAAADAFASDVFFNDQQRAELVLLSTKSDVEQFARKTNVSTGVVAGQYGHYTGVWSRFGKLRESQDIAAVLAKVASER